jgi:hypothetical protein
MPFQSRKSSWKMSFPAHPDWIFQVTASDRATTVGAAEVPAPVAAGADDVAGAFCERHDVTKAARPESDPYLRNPRRENFVRRLTELSTS